MTLHIDPLPLAPIVDKNGVPTIAFQRLWQKTKDALMAQEAAQDAVIEDLAAQLVLIQAAQAAADDAQTSATQAAREAARLTSYPDPSNVLTAADLGASAGAEITVAGHQRIYPVQGAIDVPDTTITGTAVSGGPFAYSTQYSIYYDDTTLADTTPTFAAVPTATQHATAQPGAAAGRHFVGVVTTPADGGGGTTGTGSFPPGGGGGTALP